MLLALLTNPNEEYLNKPYYKIDQTRGQYHIGGIGYLPEPVATIGYRYAHFYVKFSEKFVDLTTKKHANNVESNYRWTRVFM
ncbi:hypothetical protein HZS_73 [Henneguya salminicola]|nr:hypothetical protein HZS_73 [Henneguya salminicola]